MPDNGEDSREQGVEFGDLADDLESQDYPASTEELAEAYGDRTVEYADGEESFGDLIGTYPDDQTFDDAESVTQAVLNMVGEGAVGRERYSDRGAGEVDPGSSDESL